MAVVTILTTPTTRPKVGALVFDAILSEGHEFSMSVTQFPVEEGAPITDHVRQEPAKITLEAIITNTPIKAEKLSQFVYDVASGRENILVEESATRVSGAFNMLLAMVGENENYDAPPRVIEPVDVVTTLRVYRGMVITSLSIMKDTPEEALRFTMTLQKIRRATLRSTYTRPLTKTASGVSGSADDPNNVSDQVSDQDKKKDSATSLAVDIKDFAGDFAGDFWKRLVDSARNQLSGGTAP